MILIFILTDTTEIFLSIFSPVNNKSHTQQSIRAMLRNQGKKCLMQLSYKCVLILLFKFWDKTISRPKDKLEQNSFPSSCGTQEICRLKRLIASLVWWVYTEKGDCKTTNISLLLTIFLFSRPSFNGGKKKSQVHLHFLELEITGFL